MDKEKIWKEIIDIAQEERKANEKQPDEMTISEFSKQTGLNRSAATRFLDEKVKAGELEMRVISLNGVTKVYRPI